MEMRKKFEIWIFKLIMFSLCLLRTFRGGEIKFEIKKNLRKWKFSRVFIISSATHLRRSLTTTWAENDDEQLREKCLNMAWNEFRVEFFKKFLHFISKLVLRKNVLIPRHVSRLKIASSCCLISLSATRANQHFEPPSACFCLHFKEGKRSVFQWITTF